MTQTGMQEALPRLGDKADKSGNPLDRVAWQSVVFAPVPKRTELLSLSVSWPLQALQVRVHRNTPFEFIEGLLKKFLSYAGYDLAVEISDYDDSLSSINQIASSGCRPQVEMLWLDYEQYSADMSAEALAEWVGERLRELRTVSTVPILVPNWPGSHERACAFNEVFLPLARSVSGVHVFDIEAIRAELGEAFFDRRLKTVGATRWSGAAMTLIARSMGLVALPACIRPRLKAIALDLDQTLYEGVLGEDGPEGVRLTPGYEALQQKCRDLKESGLFLALVSKNEREDVEALFQKRRDFPLRWEDFSAVQIGWGGKSAALHQIAADLHIGVDAILFVDDNPGELAQVGAAIPELPLLHASNPEVVLRGLELVPNLAVVSQTATDLIRVADMAAERERAAARMASVDPQSYLRSLQIRVELRWNEAQERVRIHEIANKTNQFILSLWRPTEAEIERFLAQPDAGVVTFYLSDRLSNSGNVGAAFFRRESDDLHVLEVCVSCRALGRGIEDLVLSRAIDLAQQHLGGNRVVVHHKTGPRNGPGLAWLSSLVEEALAANGAVAIEWPKADVVSRINAIPAEVVIL